MTNESALRAHYDRCLRREAAPDPGARIDRTDRIVRQVADGDGWNGVLWSDLDETLADAAIAEQIRLFDGGRFEWKLHHYDRPTDLADRLTAAGFTADDDEAVMIAPTASIAKLSTDVDGVWLVDVDDLDDAFAVHDAVFGPDEDLRRALAARLAAEPDAMTLTVAHTADGPVSAARIEYGTTGFAGLWGGGTLPAWRGRGVYRALVAHRARLALARGIDHLQVDALPTSEPILARLGFTRVATTTPYTYTGNVTGVH